MYLNRYWYCTYCVCSCGWSIKACKQHDNSVAQSFTRMHSNLPAFLPSVFLFHTVGGMRHASREVILSLVSNHMVNSILQSKYLVSLRHRFFPCHPLALSLFFLFFKSYSTSTHGVLNTKTFHYLVLYQAQGSANRQLIMNAVR